MGLFDMLFGGKKRNVKETAGAVVDTNKIKEDIMKFKKKDKKTDEDKEKQEIDKLKEKGISKDKYPELYIRKLAEATAIDLCYTVFDIYKKAHGMASLPYMEDTETQPPRTKAEEVFGFGKPK